MGQSSGRRFREHFIWGVASSSYQIEGAVSEGGRGPSIWDTFSHGPGNVAGGDTGDRAIDHYHRFRDDVALMADLGIDAYRFSLAWARVLPDGTGRVNEEGIEFYRSLCLELLSTGITPLATLYHWDLPQALQDRGGWLEPRSVEWFAEYAAVAKEHLGDLIQMWATHNEPWCAAFLGHSAGVFAPGLADPGAGFIAAHHIMLSHHAAVTAMRSARPHLDDRLGVVLNLIPAWPATDSPEDVEAAATVDTIHNGLFLDAAIHGRYPEKIIELHRRFDVDDRVDVEQLAAARADIDYLGVNYYNVNRFMYEPGAPAPPEFPGADGAVLARPPGQLTAMGWGVEPGALTSVLLRAAREAPDLPLYVTENGAAYHDVVGDGGEVVDAERIAYLEAHIEAVADALEAGVDVRGYFVWSIFDNFEWAEGYARRFGLVRVDYETLERTVKASGKWYRDFIASQRVG
ncbi:MAG TPA: GH1 family beta-glucosidase [Acidimicrobiia bacterium]|nr:GH1 family beta-glucosidase [Acidimicrobiia bacterium]